MLKKIINNILDYIFPNFCLNCNKEGYILCNTCFESIKLLPLENKSQNQYFDNCYICCQYNDPLIAKIIKKYKYNCLKDLNKYLINILYRQAKRINLKPQTIITNIPLHKKKRNLRGFDQTEILAQGLAQKLNLEYKPLLKRIKNTKPQAKLKKEERKRNICNSFLTINSSNNKDILLVDDIMTTGETLNQASKVLKEYNNKIIAIVIAKNN